jgi:hypothetical protein
MITRKVGWYLNLDLKFYFKECVSTPSCKSERYLHPEGYDPFHISEVDVSRIGPKPRRERTEPIEIDEFDCKSVPPSGCFRNAK